ncbi:hypothetical protein KGO5_01752 [Sinorhizobium sp. KGO-5]|uniref:hypothetical protein n=1 Tax=Sinorhizobium sp. KGO-5 TaxID=1470810 RepID=UPI002948FFA7|nr:hypothetical protein KGO5_01752 [Sinorhizobium sp. KGO-5]
MDSFYFTFKETSFHHGFYAEVIATNLVEAKEGIETAYPGQWQGGETAEEASDWLPKQELQKLVALHKPEGEWKIKRAGW